MNHRSSPHHARRRHPLGPPAILFLLMTWITIAGAGAPTPTIGHAPDADTLRVDLRRGIAIADSTLAQSTWGPSGVMLYRHELYADRATIAAAPDGHSIFHVTPGKVANGERVFLVRSDPTGEHIRDRRRIDHLIESYAGAQGLRQRNRDDISYTLLPYGDGVALLLTQNLEHARSVLHLFDARLHPIGAYPLSDADPLSDPNAILLERADHPVVIGWNGTSPTLYRPERGSLVEDYADSAAGYIFSDGDGGPLYRLRETPTGWSMLPMKGGRPMEIDMEKPSSLPAFVNRGRLYILDRRDSVGVLYRIGIADGRIETRRMRPAPSSIAPTRDGLYATYESSNPNVAVVGTFFRWP